MSEDDEYEEAFEERSPSPPPLEPIGLFRKRKSKKKVYLMSSTPESSARVAGVQARVVAESILGVSLPKMRSMQKSLDKSEKDAEGYVDRIHKLELELSNVKQELEDVRTIAQECIKRGKARGDLGAHDAYRALVSLRDQTSDVIREATDAQEETGMLLGEVTQNQQEVKNEQESSSQALDVAIESTMTKQNERVKLENVVEESQTKPPELPPRASPPALPPRNPPVVQVSVPEDVTKEEVQESIGATDTRDLLMASLRRIKEATQGLGHDVEEEEEESPSEEFWETGKRIPSAKSNPRKTNFLF